MIYPSFSPAVLAWTHYVAIALFGIGLTGFLLRRNAIVVLMCVELMLNAVNLIFLEVAMRTQSHEGILFVVFVVTVAAAEAAIGLAILLNLYRKQGTLELNLFRMLQG